MRRPTVLALAAVLAVLLLALPAAASEASAATEVLAVDDEPAGPVPQPRTEEGNSATMLGGYEDLEVPFTWGAAWILTALIGLGGLAGYGFWRYRVTHPS